MLIGGSPKRKANGSNPFKGATKGSRAVRRGSLLLSAVFFLLRYAKQYLLRISHARVSIKEKSNSLLPQSEAAPLESMEKSYERTFDRRLCGFLRLRCRRRKGGRRPSGIMRAAYNRRRHAVPALFRQVHRDFDVKINVLLRPRFGDFLYSEEELDQMCGEIELFRDLGANGAVIGVLTPDGQTGH
jgi:hypothetical protein